MIKAKKVTYESRNKAKAIKEVMKTDTVDLFVELPEKEYWKLKQYVVRNRTTLKDWVIAEIRKLHG